MNKFTNFLMNFLRESTGISGSKLKVQNFNLSFSKATESQTYVGP